ncbi:UNVERIFIED_CONTAM: cofilin [Siphonaria sp. JEL0065]|nr:cofilin [Siphonaria sp. JEL0065]
MALGCKAKPATYGSLNWRFVASGVTAINEVVTQFEELKLRRKYAFIVYKIDGSSIVTDLALEKEAADKLGSEATYEKFISLLPESEGRYGVYDFEFDNGSEGIRNKLVFFLWAPDTAPIKARMVYASSKQAIRQRLDGINIEIQATDFSELAHEAVFEKVAPKGATPVVKAPKA